MCVSYLRLHTFYIRFTYVRLIKTHEGVCGGYE